MSTLHSPVSSSCATLGVSPKICTLSGAATMSPLQSRPIENFNQLAAPAETRTPNLHRAKTAHRECGWKGGDSGDSAGEKSLSNEKIKEPT